MQHPITPTKDPINAIIVKPSKTIGCFRTTMVLYFMDSIAFKSPKIISGTDSKVIKEMKYVITVPMNWKWIYENKVAWAKLMAEIKKEENMISVRYGSL